MLMRVQEQKSHRPQWSLQKHLLEIDAILGGRRFPTIDAQLAESRADRNP